MSNACLQFSRTRKEVVGYVESDFTVDLDRRRSLKSYVFTVVGCVVS
jgi:hypothetical protein